MNQPLPPQEIERRMKLNEKAREQHHRIVGETAYAQRHSVLIESYLRQQIKAAYTAGWGDAKRYFNIQGE